MATQPAFSYPVFEIKKSFDLLKSPKLLPPSVGSPIKIGVGGKINVKGTVAPTGAHSKVSFSSGKGGVLQADVEQSVKTEFCDIKFKEQVKPGEVSKIGIEIGRTGIPFTIELAANMDYTKPISITVKWPNLIRLSNAKLTLGGIGVAGDWSFSGAIDPQIEVYIAMNELWPGWTSVLRLLAQQARTGLQSGASAVRAVYFAGELGTVSTAGAAAMAFVVASFGVIWAGFGLYQCGKAVHEGRAMAVRYAFSNGYGRMLADLTSDTIPVRTQEAIPLLKLDWKGALSRIGVDYVNGIRDALGNEVESLGKAAILQDVDNYIKSNRNPKWNIIQKNHQQRYGTQDETRRQRYLSILYDQVQQGKDTIGIQLS